MSELSSIKSLWWGGFTFLRILIHMLQAFNKVVAWLYINIVYPFCVKAYAFLLYARERFIFYLKRWAHEGMTWSLASLSALWLFIKRKYNEWYNVK